MTDRLIEVSYFVSHLFLSFFIFWLIKLKGPYKQDPLKLTFSFSHLVFQQINCSVTSYKLGN